MNVEHYIFLGIIFLVTFIVGGLFMRYGGAKS